MSTSPVATKPSKRIAVNVAHPIRCNILSILSVRVASPNEIARDLRKTVGDVSYHVRVLRDNGAIELIDTRQVRGSTEHFYRAVTNNFVTDEEYEQMTPEERIGFAEGTILFGQVDAGAALDARTMVQRTDHCIARLPARLDEEGWAKTAAIYRRAFYEVEDVRVESEARLAKDPEADAIHVANQLAFFEMPAPTRNTLPESIPAD